MRYLLDSNIISEPMRRAPAPGIIRGLREHNDEIVIAAPVWHELRFGCARLPPSRRRNAIERYLAEVVLATFPVLDYDRHAADWHARERARLSAAGETPPFVDGQIAAIAVVNELIIVTSNIRDFERFQGVQMQSWS